jgi:hypothetical protein
MLRRSHIQLIFFLHFLFAGYSNVCASEILFSSKPNNQTYLDQSTRGIIHLVANEESAEDSDNIPQLFDPIHTITYYNVLSSILVDIPKIDYTLHKKFNLLFIYLDIPPPACS